MVRRLVSSWWRGFAPRITIGGIVVWVLRIVAGFGRRPSRALLTETFCVVENGQQQRGLCCCAFECLGGDDGLVTARNLKLAFKQLSRACRGRDLSSYRVLQMLDPCLGLWSSCLANQPRSCVFASKSGSLEPLQVDLQVDETRTCQP